MNYVEGLIILVGMVIGTFCIKEIIKTVFVEIGLYKQKLNKPYEKAINNLFEGLNVLTDKMGKLLDLEMNKNSEAKVNVNWDESLKE